MTSRPSSSITTTARATAKTKCAKSRRPFTVPTIATSRAGDATEMNRLRTALQPALARPTPGRRHVYLRLSQKEPFDILYFTPALTTMANVDDQSFSIMPELLYTLQEYGASAADILVARIALVGFRREDQRAAHRAAGTVFLLRAPNKMKILVYLSRHRSLQGKEERCQGNCWTISCGR